MKGLILAGGKGTRLRPLTINTPKPVVPVANAPFLLYQIDLMRSAGIDEIILSLSYQPRKIEDLLKDGSDYGVTIKYAVEGMPLGTGGAFKNAEEQIDSTTVVFNGDVLTGLDLNAVIARHRSAGAVATLVLTPVENPSAYGLVEIDSDVIIRSGVRIENSVIGRNCKIDEGAHVIDSVVWAGTTIDAEARVFGSIVGKGCMIGRSAVLNPGVVLGDKTVVTDFSLL